MNKKLLSLALTSTLFLSACASKKPIDATQLPDVIKIGFVGPLTGGAASYGQDMKAGIVEYFKEHPTIAGKTVEVIYEDGKCNGQDAASATQKLINIDKVQVILGGQCSGETLAAAPIAEQNKVVLLSSLSSSPAVTTAGDYIFRNYPSDEQVSKTMVETVLKDHKKIALLSEQTDYSQGYRGAIKRQLEAKGEKDALVLDETYGVDSTDFRTLLTKVKESGADVLINIAQTPPTGGFAAKQAKELGLNIPIYGGDGSQGTDFVKIAKDAAEGVRFVMVVEDESRNGYKDFAVKVASQENILFSAFAYDGAAIVAQAIEKAGYNGTAIKDYLYDMDKFQGIATDVKFDENGDNQAPAGTKEYKNGELVLVK